MPNVEAITQQVVTGGGVWLHSDQTFVINAESPNYASGRVKAEPTIALVDDLCAKTVEYLGRKPNYEEISLLAGQLHDALSGEHESASVMPLATELLERPYVNEQDLRALTQGVRNYVADTVHQMLHSPPVRVDHLAAIVDACQQLTQVDLATLNHDLVLEKALNTAGIAYADGFERSDGDVCRWVDNWGDGRVRLLKLHGSIDWWDYRFADEPWHGWITCRNQGDDAFHPKRSGIDLPRDLRPVFLTGTWDKILAYETAIFADQHFRFQKALRATNRVIAIGYGFGDKAINTRVINWLARSDENTLVVCHRTPDNLRKRARGAIKNNWETWRSTRQLAIIPAHIGDPDLDFDEITTHLA